MSAVESTAQTLTEQAADWHARMRSGALSELDEARFRAWLAASPAHQREFHELSALWDGLEAVAQSPEVLAEQELIAQRAPAPVVTPVAIPVVTLARRPARASRRAVLGWALAASLIASVSVFSYRQIFGAERYVTGVGEQRTVSLDDGSVVTLNTTSQMRVRFSAGRRSIELLQGQAHFEVAKDPGRPFVVSVSSGEVVAVGTEFDVYQRADDTVVTLVEGRVNVTPPQTPPIELVAGEQLTFDATSASGPRPADLRRVSAWRSRKLDFADTPLSEAITEANRYSQQKIELRAPHLADARISGVFDAGSNEMLAEGVKAYFGLHVEHLGDDLIVLTQPAR
jgi:transmembrane sensor